MNRTLHRYKITLLFAAIVIPLQTVLALAMALLLTSNLRFAGAFLYLWAIPLGISDLASGVVWLSIFTDRGYINSGFTIPDQHVETFAPEEIVGGGGSNDATIKDTGSDDPQLAAAVQLARQASRSGNK